MLSMLLLTVVDVGKVKPWVQRRTRRTRRIPCGSEAWCLRERIAAMVARHPLVSSGRRCHNALGGKDMFVCSSTRWAPHSGRRRVRRSDKGEAARIRAIRVLVLARPASPVQTDGVIARLTCLDAVLTGRLLLAAFDLSRLARPATSATALLGLPSALFLGSRHADRACPPVPSSYPRFQAFRYSSSPWHPSDSSVQDDCPATLCLRQRWTSHDGIACAEYFAYL